MWQHVIFIFKWKVYFWTFSKFIFDDIFLILPRVQYTVIDVIWRYRLVIKIQTIRSLPQSLNFQSYLSIDQLCFWRKLVRLSWVAVLWIYLAIAFEHCRCIYRVNRWELFSSFQRRRTSTEYVVDGWLSCLYYTK